MSTIRMEESRRYRVSREAAFAYITDPDNWPAYWPDLVGITDLPNARWREPGDTMRLRLRLGGRQVNLHMTMDRIEPPSLVTYDTAQPGLPDAAHERHFEPADEGFTYRVIVTYVPRPGPAGVLDRTVIKRGIRRALRRTLDNLDRPLASLPADGNTDAE
jgi:uncharacterized protein YndB with AHSA1/START domain